MTAPLPPNRPPQQQSSSNPNQSPVNPQKRVGTTGRHGAPAATFPRFSSGRSPGSAPQTNIANRPVTPTLPTNGVEPYEQDPAEQMKSLHKQLTTQIADFWVRDQVNIMQKIMADPALAEKMGITIKIQLPGTNTPVHVYPIATGSDALSCEDLSQCEEFLQKLSAGLCEKIEQQKPASELFDEYVQTRNQFIALGEELYPSFSWKPLYERILRTAIHKTIETEGAEFIFIKEQPDSSKTLSPQVLDELALYDQKKPEEEEENAETIPKEIEGTTPKQIKIPKGKSALKNPRMEFRVAASEAEIHRHMASLQHFE